LTKKRKATNETFSLSPSPPSPPLAHVESRLSLPVVLGAVAEPPVGGVVDEVVEALKMDGGLQGLGVG